MLSNNVLATNMEEVGNLFLLQSILTNINTNLALINEGSQGQTIIVNNANLYQLAAQYYSDATQWTTIAEANGLDSPFVSGGQINSIDVTNGGSNYSILPQVNIIGNPLNADLTNLGSAIAVVDSGIITSIIVLSPGNYMEQPIIEITDASGSGSGATAVATCMMKLIIPNVSTISDGVFTT